MQPTCPKEEDIENSSSLDSSASPVILMDCERYLWSPNSYSQGSVQSSGSKQINMMQELFWNAHVQWPKF